MSTKRFVILLSTIFLITILTIVLKEKVYADPWFNYPGTRARAMGGAFVAIADDSSACWYNPAGLATEGSDFSLEVYQMATPDAFYDDEKEYNGFLGFKAGNQNVGVGFLIFAPYKIGLYFYDYYYDDYYGYYYDINGYLNETVYISSFGFAFGNRFIKLGIAFEYLLLDYSESNIKVYDYYDYYDYYYYYDYYNSYETSLKEDFSMGVSGSVGILIHPMNLKDHNLDLRIGAVYRFPSSLKISNEEYTIYDYYGYPITIALDLEEILFKKPSSYDVGIATTIPLFDLGYLTLSGQYGEVDYSTIKESYYWKYRKFSIGEELGILLTKNTLILFRSGIYSTKRIDDEEDFNEDILGITYGFAINISRRLTLEIAMEKRIRTFEYSSLDYYYKSEYSVDLFSFSLNVCF